MSDEIKKSEAVEGAEEKQLGEKALEKVAGGAVFEPVVQGKHIPTATITVRKANEKES